LASGIVLLLPVSLVFLWQITPKVRTSIRWVFVTVLGGCGLACLYWSGSKAGWLVALIVAMVALGHSSLSMKSKRILICGIFILGLAGFAARYAASYKKQTISVVTRFVYWKAALQICARHPLLGTGPGTFSVPYQQIKRPSDDFARLCHNDYLEQACDSGVPGFLAYAAMIAGYLSWLYRYRVRTSRGFDCYFMVWLGLMGLCLHSLVDYHLYVPALAWPMFFLMGLSMNHED
jgi:O-antigen ligase